MVVAARQSCWARPRQLGRQLERLQTRQHTVSQCGGVLGMQGSQQPEVW